MSFLEFLASIINSLAWPALLGFCVYILRDPAGKLIELISKFKYQGLEADFREVLDDIKAIEARDSGRSIVEKPETVSIDLEDLAEVSPRVAVMEAWILVEKATAKFCEHHGLPSPVSYQGLFRLSKEKNLDIDHLQTAYQEMRLLRNKASHASDFVIKPGTARDYVKAANFIISEMAMRER
jgi:hypothetical protein